METMTAVITDDTTGIPLLADQRCDRCPAHANVSVLFRHPTDTNERLPMLFCRHHYTKHADALATTATLIMLHPVA